MTRISLLILLTLSASQAGAAEFATQTTLQSASATATRPADPSANNREIIVVAPGTVWALHSGSGGMSCRTDGAVLPADNSMMRASALAAVSSRATVEIIIDTTLATVAGFCQVAVLSVVGG
jgi:hypothetical protein